MSPMSGSTTTAARTTCCSRIAARRRALQILIGDEEARTIMLEMHGIKPDRPLTHDLLRDLIEQTGNRVDRVVITSVHNQIYYADIYLDRAGLRLDSRPSDAIALAMGMGAPIFVEQRASFSPPPRCSTRRPRTKICPPPSPPRTSWCRT